MYREHYLTNINLIDTTDTMKIGNLLGQIYIIAQY